MQQKTKDLLSMGKDVMRVLRNYMFDCNITGGFPRDIASHNVPRDLDICVFNWHPNDPAEEKFFDLMVNTLENYYESVEVFDSYEDDEELENTEGHIPSFRQVRKVIKIHHTFNGVKQSVDIILIEDCHPNPSGEYARFNHGERKDTIHKVVNDFDCNVNMFIWNEQEDMPQFIGRDFLRKFTVHHSNLGPERLMKNYRNWIGFSNDLEDATFTEYKYLGRSR